METNIAPMPEIDRTATSAPARTPIRQGLAACVRPLPNQVQGGNWSQLAPSLVEQIEDAICNRRWPLYLCGETGRGKTFAMATLYQHWPVGPVVWLDFQPWLRRLMTARMNGFCSYKTVCG